MSPLQTVARGEALKRWQVDLTQLRAQRWRLVGNSKMSLLSWAVGSDALEWVLTYCVDGKGTDLVNSRGKSVRGPGPRRVASKLTADQDASTGSWYITKDKVVSTC